MQADCDCDKESPQVLHSNLPDLVNVPGKHNIEVGMAEVNMYNLTIRLTWRSQTQTEKPQMTQMTQIFIF
jgi:hypothetical protein